MLRINPEHRKMIKRHLKRGTFKVVRTSKENISITHSKLKTNNEYYFERKNGDLLVYDTKLNHLTLYIEKQQMVHTHGSSIYTLVNSSHIVSL